MICWAEATVNEVMMVYSRKNTATRFVINSPDLLIMDLNEAIESV